MTSTLFSHGSIEITREGDALGFAVLEKASGDRAFVEDENPLAMEILGYVKDNPNSKAFAARQIATRLEQEGLWLGPEAGQDLAVGTIGGGLVQDVANRDKAPELGIKGEEPEVSAALPDVKPGKSPESPEDLVADINKIAEEMAHDKKPLFGADKSAPEKGPESTTPDQSTSTVPPRPKREPIGDLRPEALSGKKAQDPYHPVRFYDEKSRHVMTDEGRQLNIRARASMQEKVLLAALQEGKERFGEPVRIAGNPIFMARMARLAVEQGIDIAPDGPFKAIAEREQRLALAKTIGHNEISAAPKAPEVPSEQFKPQVGANNVTVRSVQEDGVVVTRAGRNQYLPLENAQQREMLKQVEGQAAVLHFGKDGQLQQVSAPQKARGREQAQAIA